VRGAQLSRERVATDEFRAARRSCLTNRVPGRDT
jgi:hypothetical protein